MGPIVAQLALNRKLWGLHPIFPLSLLYRYLAEDNRVEAQPPIIMGNEAKYRVMALVSYCIHMGVREFLVRW